MLLLAVSLILALAGCTSLWLISHHRARAGWYANIGVQVLWLPYDVATHQYPLIVVSVATLVIARSSLRKVRNAKLAAIRNAEEMLRRAPVNRELEPA